MENSGKLPETGAPLRPAPGIRPKRCSAANALTNSEVGAACCRSYPFKISIPVGSRTLIKRTGIFYSIH